MNVMRSCLTSRSPRHSRRGFAVAAILYMLGLIGVLGGVLYSGNMQSIRSVMTVQNSLSVRSDMQAAANTLSAEAVFSANNQTLCPPRSVHQTSGNPCSAAPVALTQLGDLGSDPHVPANAASASASGSPVEVGVFMAGAGLKQLDPYGHYYIYCRWENPRSAPASPVFVLLSAGPDGNLQTKCGDATAQGDDSYMMLTVGEAINRAALWQSDASNDVSYGTTGSKVTIDSSGDLTAAGNITAVGSLNGASAAITNAVTAGSLTTTGNITAKNVTASNIVAGSTGSFTTLDGSTLEVSGAATITGTTTLGTLNAQASTLNSLTVTNSEIIGGGLTLQGGDLVIPNGYSYAQIDSTGNARRLIALSPENDILLGGHNGTGNIYFLTNNTTVGFVDVAGDLEMTGNIVGANGYFGNINASGSASITGALTGSSATFSGNVTAASFTGSMAIGSSGVSVNGILPVTNGGTGANNAASALNNLGVTSGGVFNTGLLTAGLINGGYLKSGTVTSTQLNTTGVAAGNCPSPTVGSDGRITACGSSVTATAAGSTGDIQFNNSGSFSASNGLYWNNAKSYLGIGTASPAGILDVEGGTAVANTTGSNINIVAQSGGSGNTNGGTITLMPGAGSGTGYAGTVLIGNGCTVGSWLANGLCVTGDIISNMGFATSSFQPYGWGTSSANITGVGGGNSGDQIRFITNSIERARFDGNGNFGIGTASPSHTLEINGSLSNNNAFTLGNYSYANTILGNTTINGLVLVSSGVFTPGVTGGSLTSSSLTLQSTNGTGTSDYINFKVGANIEAARITTNGSLGIGTTAPATTLDVKGAIRAASSTIGTACPAIGAEAYNSSSGAPLYCSASLVWTAVGGGLGVGQSWQNVTSSRALGTTYTNTTANPILVSVYCNWQTTTGYVNGSMVAESNNYASSTNNFLSFVVPAGSTYSVSGSALNFWAELR